MASRHMKRRKKRDDFWLPGAESFPMVYIMNDFAAIIFRRYYTLKDNELASENLSQYGSLD